MLFESVRALHQRSRKPLADADLTFSFEWGPVILLERGFVIESIQVAHTAAHKQRDHRFGAGFEVRRLWQVGRTRKAFLPGARPWFFGRRLGQKAVLIEQVNQRQSADS